MFFFKVKKNKKTQKKKNKKKNVEQEEFLKIFGRDQNLNKISHVRNQQNQQL